MRKSRDLHTVSWIVSVVVAGSTVLAVFSGGLLPNIHVSLLRDLMGLYVILVVAEAVAIAVSATLFVERSVRQREHSRKFGPRHFFTFASAVAVVLLLWVMERRLAAQSGVMQEDIPWLIWLLWTPTIFGMGCAVYAVLWRVENTLYCVKDSGKAPDDGHRARTSRDLHVISWVVSVVVAGSALLAGGLLPNLHAHLLGHLEILPFVVARFRRYGSAVPFLREESDIPA